MRVGPSSRDYICIPSPPADKLNFGILSGSKPLGIPDLKVGNIAEVYATADILDPARLTSRKIRDVRAYEPKCTFGFSDIIPLAMGMLRERGSTITRIPCPTEYAVGLLCYKEVSRTMRYSRGLNMHHSKPQMYCVLYTSSALTHSL